MAQAVEGTDYEAAGAAATARTAHESEFNHGNYDNHLTNTSNPHSVDAEDVGAIPTESSSTDKAIVIWDGTGGDAVQNSDVTINDDGDIIPDADNTQDLGSDSYKFYAGYISYLRGAYGGSGGNIGINSNIWPTTSSWYCGTSAHPWTGVYGEYMKADKYYGDSSNYLTIQGHLKPSGDSSWCCGTSDKYWHTTYTDNIRATNYYGNSSNYAFIYAHQKPSADNSWTSGRSDARWHTVYSVNGVVETSDKNLKNNITDVLLGLDFILSLKPRSWNWKEENVLSDKHKRHGLIAQEVAEIVSPENFAGVICDEEIDEETKEKKQYWSLNYSQFIGPLIKAVQEQQLQINELKERIVTLEMYVSE